MKAILNLVGMVAMNSQRDAWSEIPQYLWCKNLHLTIPNSPVKLGTVGNAIDLMW